MRMNIADVPANIVATAAFDRAMGTFEQCDF